ncbi:MAG: GMC family oxidoreductase N-terminal domain-containing protein [Dehalococcoidia bacterium]|nr:GMC family oxidoreductase N-terminal domain-containing protein [Dehalococcoidia bacterium]
MQYDDIIVGAGSSGAVLAARLTEDPNRHVLLLEAGPDYADVDSTPEDLLNSYWISVIAHDWGLKADAVPERPIDFPRGKVTGGSSAVNGAMAIRGVPQDYDAWSEAGNHEWSWERCLPYFRTLEDDRDARGDFHGTGGPIPVTRWKDESCIPSARLLRRLPRPRIRAGGRPQRPHGHRRRSMADEPRGAHPHLYGDRLPGERAPPPQSHHPPALPREPRHHGGEPGGRRRGGIGRRNAGGVRQEHHPGRGRGHEPAHPLAVRYRAATGTGVARHRCMLDRPSVGANLVDHPVASVTLLPKDGVCSMENPVVQIGTRYTAPGSKHFNDMQLYMISQIDMTQLPELQAALGAPDMVFSLISVLQKPYSRGSVKLASADFHEPPHIDLRYHEDPEDMRRAKDGVRLAWEIAHRPEVEQFHNGVLILTEDMVNDDAALEEYIRATSTTLYHPVSTCKMGPSEDPTAVVDQHGRVYGVPGLRVVDA